MNEEKILSPLDFIRTIDSHKNLGTVELPIYPTIHMHVDKLEEYLRKYAEYYLEMKLKSFQKYHEQFWIDVLGKDNE